MTDEPHSDVPYFPARLKLHGLTWVMVGVVGVAMYVAETRYGGFLSMYEDWFKTEDFELPAELLLPCYVVFCCGFVVEGWLRRGDKRWQFRLADLLLVMAAVAVTLAIVLDQYRCVLHARTYLDIWPYVDIWPYALIGGPWLLRIPLVFGLLCASYTSAWLVTQGARAAIPWIWKTVKSLELR